MRVFACFFLFLGGDVEGGERGAQRGGETTLSFLFLFPLHLTHFPPLHHCWFLLFLLIAQPLWHTFFDSVFNAFLLLSGGQDIHHSAVFSPFPSSLPISHCCPYFCHIYDSFFSVFRALFPFLIVPSPNRKASHIYIYIFIYSSSSSLNLSSRKSSCKKACQFLQKRTTTTITTRSKKKQTNSSDNKQNRRGKTMLET